MCAVPGHSGMGVMAPYLVIGAGRFAQGTEALNTFPTAALAASVTVRDRF